MSENKSAITINEVRQARAELIEVIGGALQDFTKKTNLTVEGIDITNVPVRRGDDPDTRTIAYTVEVDVSL
jgi:hypothetical protein